MYQVVGVWKLVTVFATIAVALGLLSHFVVPIDSILTALRRTSAAVSLSGVIVFLVGQTKAFPWLCTLPIIKEVFPPLDGEWTGTFNTNFPQIAAAFEIDAQDAGEPVIAKFTFKARLLKVRLSSVSIEPKPGYMRSDTTAFSIIRCSDTDREIIRYVYDAFVGEPCESDVPSFYGAAKLTVLRDGDDLVLEGNYWTDRSWQKGHNTAGSLRLARVA